MGKRQTTRHMFARTMGPLFVVALAAAANSSFAADYVTHSSRPRLEDTKETGNSLNSGSELTVPDTELVDIPTAGIVDYGGYSTRTRFFSNGGVVDWLSFGVFQRLNIGASLNVDRLLGTSSPVRVTTPSLQAKFRFYDGDRVIPAFAIGYDGQGYLYNRPAQLYNQRQRGLYLVGSQEIVLPGLLAHAGTNMSDFNSNAIFGFVGMSYDIEDRVSIMSEWDNVHNIVRDSRLNFGLRVYVSPSFSLDLAVRGVGQAGHYSDGTSRGPERVAMLKYTGNF